MVGGTNYHKSQFNLAVQGERQPGSSFKPFVLATALEQGISPATTFVSKPQAISLGDRDLARPELRGRLPRPINLDTATTYSDNTVYAQLTRIVGPATVARMAHRLGITSPLQGYFSIGLGVEAVNPLEMARAYAHLRQRRSADRRRVLTATGRARSSRSNSSKELAVSRCSVLKPENDARSSTRSPGRREVGHRDAGPRSRTGPVAGKTGTTENYGDAWFVGYTPQLVPAVWVGYPNELVPMLTSTTAIPSRAARSRR